MRDVVVAALNKKDAEAAEYASERVVSAAERSGALQRLALHHHAAGDVARSWGFMNGALKLIDSLDVEGPRPEDKPGGEAHRKAVGRLLRVCYALTPVFQVLSRFDAAEAASVAVGIGRREFRPCAALGVVTASGRK